MTDAMFLPVGDFSRSTLYALLQSAYAYEPRYAQKDERRWRETDDFFFDHPAIAASCALVTAVAGVPAGFIGWDPRALPEQAELGYSCIAAPYKGKGLGAAQLAEALRRIAQLAPRRVAVTTDALLLPAQRMYQGAGFVPVRRWREPQEGFAAEHIDYELLLNS